MKIKGCLLCLCVVIEICKASVITIATYNLWNVMFNWEVRKQYIATKLSQLDVDVAAFQEVRSHRRSSWSQLHELQQLLPSYKWLLYQSVQEVTPPKYGAPPGWEMEGLGILSRLPITHHALQSLVQDSRLDKNKRVVLHANVSLSGGKSFNISVIHLSSDRRQQCNNVAQILNYLKDRTAACSVILGDFNTYNDYEWPMLALQEGKISSANKCYASRQHHATLEKVRSYIDVWKQANPTKQGYTFSNMPKPGFESRPDRILVSGGCFSVKSSQLAGFGSEYKSMFVDNVIGSRYRSVFESAKASYYAYSGSSCYFDCGPHGSCRCGICVDGGDKRNCLLPNCSECSATLFKHFIILAAFTLYLILNCLYAILKCLQILKTMSRICDNFNKLFFTCEKNMRRKWWLYICCPFFRLPVICAIILNVVFLIVIIYMWQNVFKESLTSVHAVIPEEFNPSDHLMVIGQLVII